MSRTVEELRVVETHERMNAAASWSATLRLALVLSAVAAIVATVLAAVAEVPTEAMVLTVIVVGFGLSWMRTDRRVG